jgi:ferritin
MNKKLEAALNKQINEEAYSAYLYLSMVSYFESVGLKGFANWMRVQNQEETFHMTRIFDFVLTRGGKVKLLAIAEPQTTWKNSMDAFQATLKHEEHITACINGLVDLARDEKENATFNFLQWFISEQVEEEDNVNTIIAKLKLAGDNGSAIYMLDQELATRVFTPPVVPA